MNFKVRSNLDSTNSSFRYGRDYYINDAKRASGTRKKSGDILKSQLSTEEVSEHFNSQPPPQPIMFEENYCNGVQSTSVDSSNYLMNKFLMATGVNTPPSSSPSPSPSIRRSTSLKSFRMHGGGLWKTLKSSPLTSPEMEHDPDDRNSVLSLDRKTYDRRKTKPSLSYASELSIPAKILCQFEAKSLYTDLKRDSLRARNGTKNFALNPIFDDLPNEPEAKVHIVHTTFNSNVSSNPTSSISDTDSTMSWQYLQTEIDCRNNCIETSFDSLSSIKRKTTPFQAKEFTDNLY